jgi:hypothetical protein
MTVPKASMNKDRNPKGGQYDIGLTRQISYVQSITTPLCTEQRPDNLLGSSVLAANARHVVAALRGRMDVGHFGCCRIGRYKLLASETLLELFRFLKLRLSVRNLATTSAI